MDYKTRNALYLIFGAIVYLFAVAFLMATLASITAIDVNVLFALSLIPLIGILVIMWSYGLRVKLPWGEIEYYPVNAVMKKPLTVDEDATGRDAERLMEKEGVDFVNVVDKNGSLKGIFTRADAHKARMNGKINRKIVNLMTGLENIVFGREDEDIEDLLERIGKSKHTRLPILDKNNRLAGVVDAVDLIEYIMKSM